MLHAFDDYPVHQAPHPILQPATGDPNQYDRYFFHGYDASTGMIFVVAMGLYPNREIIDAAFCVSADGHQRSVFASGRATSDRETSIGPIRVEVVEPMRTVRVTVDAAAQGLAADLTFDARSVAVQEPRQTMMDRRRVIMDSCRFTQFGRWEGSLSTGDVSVDVRPEDVAATRDRSWGVRPLSGGPPAAPPSTMPGIFWIWCPLQFDDGCAHMAISELVDGHRTLETSVLVDDLPGPDASTVDPTGQVEHGARVTYDLEWEPGWRRAKRAAFDIERLEGRDPHHYELTPVGRIHMRGVGYTHLERGHGAWHGELDVHGEELVHADLDPSDFTGIHTHTVVTVDGTRRGVGVLEQVALGDHRPTGLSGFVDPPAGG